MFEFLNFFPSKKTFNPLDEIYKYLDSETMCLEAIRDSGLSELLGLEQNFTIQSIFAKEATEIKYYSKNNTEGRKIGDASGTIEYDDEFSVSSKIILDAIVLKIKIDFDLSNTIDPENLSSNDLEQQTIQKDQKNEKLGQELKRAIVDNSISIIAKISNLSHYKAVEITGEQTTQAQEHWFVAGLMAFLNAIAYVFCLLFCCHQPYEKVSP